VAQVSTWKTCTCLRLGEAFNLFTCLAFESLAYSPQNGGPVLALSFPGKCTSFCQSSETLPMEQLLDLLAVEPLWLLEVVWVTNTPNGIWFLVSFFWYIRFGADTFVPMYRMCTWYQLLEVARMTPLGHLQTPPTSGWGLLTPNQSELLPPQCSTSVWWLAGKIRDIYTPGYAVFDCLQ